MRRVLLLLLLVAEPLFGQYNYDIFTSNDTQTQACNLRRYCGAIQYPDRTSFTCLNFRDLSELDKACLGCELNITVFGEIYLYFIFPDNTILSSGLSIISDMLTFFSMHSIISESGLQLFFQNLKGLDLDLFSVLKLTPADFIFTHIDTNLNIIQSDLVFYYKGVNLMGPEKCNKETYGVLLNNDNTNSLSWFASFVLSKVTVKHKLCKLLFQNVELYGMDFTGTSLSFLPDTNTTSNMVSSVGELHLSNDYKVVLDVNYLEPRVFSQVKYLSILFCSVLSIQEDLFKNRFHNLHRIELALINSRGLFHSKKGVAWIKNIHYDIPPVDLSNGITPRLSNLIEKRGFIVIFQTTHYFQEYFNLYPVSFFPYYNYRFPDEDFCLFYDFPFQKLVFPSINPLPNITCTSAWLLQFKLVNNPDIQVPVCDFKNLSKSCDIKQASNATEIYESDPYFVFYYLTQYLNEAKYILIGIIGVIASGLGFVSTLFIVITILFNYKRRKAIRTQPKNKNQEIVMLEQPLYKYLLFNSIINSVFLLMYLLDYAVPCHQIITHNAIYRNCIFQNIISAIIGNYLKLLSNFTSLQISLNRYLLVGKDHSERLINLSQLSVTRFFIYTALSSALLSSIVYFQRDFFLIKTHITGETNIYYVDTSYHFYFWGSSEKTANYQEIVSKIKQLPVLTAFTVINDLFGYFLFCLFSIIIDLRTVKKLKEALQEKVKLKGDEESKKNKRESEQKSIMMVLTTSLTNILFRAPELVSIVFYYIVTHDGGYVFKMLCWAYASCLTFTDIANVFFIMSLCFNLIFYVKFNSVFSCSFYILIERFLKTFKSK